MIGRMLATSALMLSMASTSLFAASIPSPMRNAGPASSSAPSESAQSGSTRSGASSSASHSRLDAAQETANRWIDEGDVPAERASKSLVEEVRKGDTLSTVLARVGVNNNQAAEALKVLREVYNPRDLRPGQSIRISLQAAEKDADLLELQAIAFQASIERDVAVERDPAGTGFKSHEIPRTLKQSVGRKAALIESSLFQAGIESGVPVEVMMEMIRIFSYDVDFQRDIQPGDMFEVVFEQTHDESGKLARTGKVMYASMTLSGHTMRLYNFAPQGDRPDFFNPKGESVRKALLKTPIDGAKITSSFGMRNHPILGYSLMHRGIDFGAPSGTPINAAGDGTVDRVGGVNGYGNYIRIRHNDQYSTAYAHMSRYANGIKPGSRVRQGDVIGYVGMTGRATGPHLHYEVLVKNEQINPMSVKLPTGRKLDGKDMKDFLNLQRQIDKLLSTSPDPLVAKAQE